MLPVPVYYALVVVCCGYALLKGAAPERIGTAILVVGSLLSLAARSSPAGRFGSVETGVFVVDIVCLGAFLILALRAARYWPLWIAGLQLIGTAGHLVKLVDPGVMRNAYAIVLVIWGYLMLFILAWGTYRHQQRLKKFGVDRSWSSSWGRSGPTQETGPTD